jgi:hypothetical protein
MLQLQIPLIDLQQPSSRTQLLWRPSTNITSDFVVDLAGASDKMECAITQTVSAADQLLFAITKITKVTFHMPSAETTPPLSSGWLRLRTS